jgi:xylulokinase
VYLLGLDIGSSSVKASLVDARTASTVASVHAPATEMDILAVQAGWAEQHPEIWWENCCIAVKKLLKKAKIKKTEVASIGISYQMHGLVAVDKAGEVVRPSIIWCDSRAVEIGNKAFRDLSEITCLQHYLNSPGNFTASKLKWVKENEPALFDKIHKIMLPGDYIAYRLTDEMTTTVSGLSEGILWDFKGHCPANILLDYYGIPKNMIPDLAPTFGHQGKLTKKAAAAIGLSEGVPVTYRAGDQPNNALSLNVLHPGEVAATGGTSGVVYGVVDKLVFDEKNRINSFAHVNHTQAKPRIGVLLCINGAGIQYSWTRKNLATEGTSYPALEKMGQQIPIGSDGLRIIPFGNGAERMFGNQNLGAQVHNLHFNRHGKAHFYRASLEGVAFSFVYGMKILQELGMNVSVLRVGNDNLFQSDIFSSTISTLLDCQIELLSTTGATGAAIASGVGIGLWKEASEGLGALQSAGKYEPRKQNKGVLEEAYQDWAAKLNWSL